MKPIHKILSVNADRFACGHYRIIWPDQVINSRHENFQINTLEALPTFPSFYEGISKIKVQRPCSSQHIKYFQWLQEIKNKTNLKVIYEVDDIILSEDIPKYNSNKDFFHSQRENIISLMKYFCDEILTPSVILSEYYKDKTGNNNVSVIPNYVPKIWMDRFFSEEKMLDRYTKSKSKPKILFPVSASHFDYKNKNNGLDDFTHITDLITKTVDDFEWIFFTSYPLSLHKLVTEGKIKCYSFQNIYDYPYIIDKIEPNLIVAPLSDSIFNQCKSDIKLKEACSMGIPSIMQDLAPYKKAFLKFKTGSELADLIKLTLKDESSYINYCKEARSFAEDNWLENEENIGKHIACYTKNDSVPLNNLSYY